MTLQDVVIAEWTGIDRFSVGCIGGLILTVFLSFFQKKSLLLPFLIPLCGLWTAFPFILSRLDWVPYSFFQSGIQDKVFFTWIFDHVEFVQHDDYIFILLLICCLYIFLYYAQLAKLTLEKKEYLEYKLKERGINA